MGLNETAEAEVGPSFAPLEDRLVLRSTRTETAVRSGDTAEGGAARISGFFRISDFDLRVSLAPHSTRNSEEPNKCAVVHQPTVSVGAAGRVAGILSRQGSGPKLSSRPPKRPGNRCFSSTPPRANNSVDRSIPTR